MKLILTIYEDHAEITVKGPKGDTLHAYTFADKHQARAFVTGWRCCQMVVNGLVQGLPQTEETIRA